MSALPISGHATPFDAIRREDDRGEHWSARDLMPLLGYDQWRRFEDTIERAMAAAANSGAARQDHFAGAGKMVAIGSGATRYVQDYRLTRYGAYLVAMNGDPRKLEIAGAQTYFAVKAREAEVAPAPPRLPQTYAAALRELAAQVEETERVKAELAETAPKAQSWEVLASGRGDFAVADAAKVLSRDPAIELGRDRLFAVLAELRWVFRQAGDRRWRAYQAAVNAGRLSELPQSYEHPRTRELTLGAPQLRVTAKGLHELHRRLGGQQPLQLRLEVAA